ncbi:HAD family hydrolase [Angustibacter luteus]|uniref:HAD family hydrolase n=1 Tax=Angustibacter luteus TaxID=658456 RepID=A0ABW1JBV8_9ACTN
MLTEHHHSATAWLFDFDGTLTDYDTADRAAVETLRLRYFADVPADEFHAASVTARTAFYRTWAAGDVSRGLDQSRVAALCNRYDRANRTDQAVDTYRAALLAETRPVRGAEALFAHLALSYRLGIVTNAYDAAAQRARIVATGLDRWVEVVVVAVEVGYFKPDPRIMVAAAEGFGVSPAECVYVGDSHEFDVAAADAAGMHPIYIGSENGPLDAPCFADVQELHQCLGT